MEELELYDPIRDGNASEPRPQSLKIRDLLIIIFRHRLLLSISFLGVLLGAILVAILQPNRYNAAMKILVKRDRIDTVVTADATAAVPQVAPGVTEEELNSEVTLLKSRDLLEQVVLSCGLQHRRPGGLLGLASLLTSHPGESAARGPLDRELTERTFQSGRTPVMNIKRTRPAASNASAKVAAIDVHSASGTLEEDVAVTKAIRALDKGLKVDVVKKTNLIEATYVSPDPHLAQRVLATLANLYIEKHVAVHRPPGAFEFFRHETERYREELTQAQKRLLDFDHQAAVYTAPLEKELALQKLAEFRVSLSQMHAGIAEAQKRISVLEAQKRTFPSRMVTQVRDADDGLLLSQLKANLLTLEQKRIELLQKFAPTYRPVQEIDAEIAKARAALAEKSQVHEQTTDRDPTYEWARSELEKTEADLASLQARAEVTAVAVKSYEGAARSLDIKEIEQGDIKRIIKSAEENYLLAQRKEEEARISDALDRGRILNVAIADPPSVPSLPDNNRFRTILFGIIFAMLMSAIVAFAAERTNSTFRSPDEVGLILNIPVLAAIPRGAISDGESPELSSLFLQTPDQKDKLQGKGKARD